jgi:hypothetical protein
VGEIRSESGIIVRSQPSFFGSADAEFATCSRKNRRTVQLPSGRGTVRSFIDISTGASRRATSLILTIFGGGIIQQALHSSARASAGELIRSWGVPCPAIANISHLAATWTGRLALHAGSGFASL